MNKGQSSFNHNLNELINMIRNIQQITTDDTRVQQASPSPTVRIPKTQASPNKPLEVKKKTRRRERKKKDDGLGSSTVQPSVQPQASSGAIPKKKEKYVPKTKRKNEIVKGANDEGLSRVQAPSNLIDIKYSFTVKPMKAKGLFFRHRNTGFKYVNLKSFCANSNALVFNSKFPPCKSFNKLHKNKQIPKALRRKYNSEGTLGKVKSEKKKKESDEQKFPNYLNQEEVEEGLKSGSLIKGFIRINPKNGKQSYVNNQDITLKDYYITSVVDRNRALEGDEVVLKLKPQSEWSEGKKTAVVVYIEKKIHPRIAVGVLLQPRHNTSNFTTFCPRDKRLPNIRIPLLYWPPQFKENPKNCSNLLFMAKITEWCQPSYATGIITETLGKNGDLKVESTSILKEFGLDTTPFPAEFSKYLPKSMKIPKSEISSRLDLRKKCIFTIDPLTAKDLDDAVSVKQLPNGRYKVGVHIADASYYLEEGTELDDMVSQKATTIYMVDDVYHMLPQELCMHCSLLPSEDKLAFSVLWEIDDQGEIYNTQFTRTVVNSCTQLAYEHAQLIIENQDFDESLFPPIFNGFTVTDITESIKILQKIASNLRRKRIENGALRIDQVKLLFSNDPKTGEPLSFRIYENKEAHRLIEEFMLLANISVAKKISESFPDIAFLRCHEPPKNTMLVELQNSLQTCGIHIDISTSGALNTSLRKYITDDFAGICRSAVLNHLLAKPMTRARYLCSSTVNSENFNHYALSVPIYTHFTSPIRRYADIMVHRLLSASLNYRSAPSWEVDYVSRIAANCNTQKYAAKRAGEASSDLYLVHYIQKHSPFVQDAVVVDVHDHSFDVIVLSTGSVVRVYHNTCEGSSKTDWSVQEIPSASNDACDKKVRRLTITFPQAGKLPEVRAIVEMFTLVKVRLEKATSYKLKAILLRPTENCVQKGD